MKRYARFLCAAALLLACVGALFSGCGSSAGNGFAEDPAESEPSGGIVTDTVNRKIVYTVQLGLDADDVAAARDGMKAKSAELGGYVQSQSEYSDGDGYSRAYLEFRIPTDRLDAFLSAAEGNGSVYQKTVSTTDITTAYVNATAQKTALEERKAALTAILDDAELTASDKISVINEISEVNAELQAIELQLTAYDSLIDYSTVTVNIYRNETDVAGIVITVIVSVLLIGLVVCLCIFGKKLSTATKKLKQAELAERNDKQI